MTEKWPISRLSPYFFVRAAKYRSESKSNITVAGNDDVHACVSILQIGHLLGRIEV